VDDVVWYFVNWSDGGGIVRESKISQPLHTITGLTPETTYDVIVTANNECGNSTESVYMVTTTLIEPSASSSSLVVIITPTFTPTGTYHAWSILLLEVLEKV